MPTIDEAQNWRGRDAYGEGGEKLGRITDIYLDEDTGQPEWAAIKTGLIGGTVTFVPLGQAQGGAGGVRFPFDKATVKDAPSIDGDGQLSQDQEAALYRHYGMEYTEARSDSGLPQNGAPAGDRTGARDQSDRTGDPTPEGSPGVVGNDVSGPQTDNAMTRSEEELRVGTRKVETGRIRLRKHVVTDHVETTVPVQREEVRLEREPITDANMPAAVDGRAISEEEHEVVLHAEEPVVEKRVVPKERVRLDKEIVAEERTVTDEVRKEQIDADTDRT